MYDDHGFDDPVDRLGHAWLAHAQLGTADGAAGDRSGSRREDDPFEQMAVDVVRRVIGNYLSQAGTTSKVTAPAPPGFRSSGGITLT